MLLAITLPFSLCLGLLFNQVMASSLEKDNAIANMILKNYHLFVNASRRVSGCCPVMVEGPNATVIEPLPEWQANVTLVVSSGTCTDNDHGFRCGVVWGDYSQPDAKYLVNLEPCEVIHQYPKAKAQYTVTAYYCSQPSGGDMCCAHYMNTISF
ncbi:uncharacterized protein [Dysidea avara]|uniref:uncharacterized protein n=1 Tax=Dysidea avara TaxID=196820 RepID=UPI00331E4D24